MISNGEDNNYCWPKGFEIDAKYDHDDHLELDMVTGNNSDADLAAADKKMIELIDHVNNMSASAQANHIMIPFGCDYAYSNSSLNYQQMDMLIKYFNLNNYNNISIEYSTPGQYITSLNKAVDKQGFPLKWPVVSDDKMVQDFNLTLLANSSASAQIFDVLNSELMRESQLAMQKLQAAEKLLAKQLIDESGRSNKAQKENIIAL